MDCHLFEVTTVRLERPNKIKLSDLKFLRSIPPCTWKGQKLAILGTTPVKNFSQNSSVR